MLSVSVKFTFLTCTISDCIKTQRSIQPIPVLGNMIKVNFTTWWKHTTQLSDLTLYQTHISQCIKFPNSTGYEIPSDASGSLQANSPELKIKIPDIGMTSCHAKNYNLKAKLEATDMKKQQHGKTKTKQGQLPKNSLHRSHEILRNL